MPKLFRNPLLAFVGSIQLAVPLLAAIALVLMGATFYEAKVGSAIVQQQIYKSGWFGLLMFALAVNLGVSALTRYPWRGARKVGFALTHLGLIVLIAGSAAVIHLGVEGMLPLRTDLGANRSIRLQGEVFEALLPDGTTEETDVAVGSSGRLQHQNLAGLTMVDYRDRTVTSTHFEDTNSLANPALHLQLTSQRMGQSVEEWLAASPASSRQVTLGPAQLELVQARTDAELQRWMSPPDLSRGRWGTIAFARDRERRELDVETSIGQAINLGRGISARLVGFWPDFRLNDRNEPDTASQTLNNPALQVQVTSPQGEERWFVFGREGLVPVRTVVAGEAINVEVEYLAPVQAETDVFRAIATPAGDWYYAVNASSGFKSGSLPLHEPIALGWADFQIEATKVFPHAALRKTVVPASADDPNAVPALLVEGAQGDRHWMQWGVPESFETDAGTVYAVYRPKALDLPFSVALENFIVDRNEGSESVAMWTSEIRIAEPESEVSTAGDRRKIWMNHPTWYRGWKIAQASWNPGDLRQSTLQIKREPAWVTALTWSGSLLVVAGISVMFYGREIAQKLNVAARKRAATASESADVPSEAIA